MLKEIIRLKIRGESNISVSKSLSLSRTTVVKYIKRIEESGLSYEELNCLTEKDIYELLSLPTLSTEVSPPIYDVLFERFSTYEKELQKPGVSRKLLWQEYKSQYPDGLGYTQFCHYFSQWRVQNSVYLHIEYKLGDKMLVDYAGKHLHYTDRDTGEKVELEVFVAILGASQMTYVEVSQSQNSENFLRSVENALWYYGGVPRAIVPDNLKSAVNRSSKYSPTLNERFADFGSWYDTTILPTRSYKPKDKAIVEGAVKIVYHRIYAVLRHQTFYSIGELNKAIAGLLPAYNEANFQGRDYSRQSVFISGEKPVLQPLPSERYPMCTYYMSKGLQNCHVLLSPDKHYYSIPYKHVGEQLRIVYDAKNVEIYTLSHERIAVHRRDTQEHQYTTEKEHLPPAHQFVLEWSAEKFIALAEKIGTPVKEVINTVLSQKTHPEQNYKSCLGILNLAKKVGNQRLIAACQRALHFDASSYQVISRILETGQDRLPLEPPPENHIPKHKNQRGKKYYKHLNDNE